MKNRKLYLCIFFCFYFPALFAVNLVGSKTDSLEISDTKWLYLKFNSDIKYADMGTEDIRIEKSVIPSILRIKSEIPYFESTSITIITMDGIVHTFKLNYGTNLPFIAFQVSDVRSEIPFYATVLSHKQTSHLIFDKKVVEVSAGVDTRTVAGGANITCGDQSVAADGHIGCGTVDVHAAAFPGSCRGV